MKPLNLFTSILIGIIFFASACKDIMEPSIKDRTVYLNAPGDNYKSTSYAISFWWGPVEDALTYHLQVVTPGFSNITSLALDTIVSGTKFTINLKPGEYQWHVRAVNGSTNTQFSAVKSFTVLNSSIKEQSVQLKSPTNNSLTNQTSTVFQWGDLYGANKYQLQIDTNNFANENALVYNQTIPGQQINYTFTKDQVYQWRVRAANDTAQAQWSTINVVTYDRTPPAAVTVTAPANSKVISLPVSLQWNSVATAAKYKLYAFKSDSTTTFNSSFPAIVNSTNYNFNTGSTGERVYWKVSAIDAAGNEGQVSVLRSFVLQ